MEENNKLHCAYSECGKRIDMDGKYVPDEKGENYFCDLGCRAMWAVEKFSRYSELRERGIEQIVTKHKIINL